MSKYLAEVKKTNNMNFCQYDGVVGIPFMSLKYYLIIFIFTIFFIYIGSYFFVKYKYATIVEPSGYFSSIFVERVTVISFYERNKFEVALYNIFMPMAYIEGLFDDEFIYQKVGFKIIRSW